MNTNTRGRYYAAGAGENAKPDQAAREPARQLKGDSGEDWSLRQQRLSRRGK